MRLEGFHAVKHALRFGASLDSLVTPDPEAVERLRAELAPDLDLGGAGLRTVDVATWRTLAPRGMPSPLLAEAPRPAWSLADAGARRGSLVVLEQPRHLGNVGAVVRVAAAADAAGVVVVGDADPFHPTVVRAAAGLHWALPVVRARFEEVVATCRTAGRALVGLDERGPALGTGTPVGGAALVLGTERHGLSPVARAAVDRTVGIPMRPGVSSLNLATAAAVALYAARPDPT